MKTGEGSMMAQKLRIMPDRLTMLLIYSKKSTSKNRFFSEPVRLKFASYTPFI